MSFDWLLKELCSTCRLKIWYGFGGCRVFWSLAFERDANVARSGRLNELAAQCFISFLCHFTHVTDIYNQCLARTHIYTHTRKAHAGCSALAWNRIGNISCTELSYYHINKESIPISVHLYNRPKSSFLEKFKNLLLLNGLAKLMLNILM